MVGGVAGSPRGVCVVRKETSSCEMTARNPTAVLLPWIRRRSAKSQAKVAKACHRRNGASRRTRILQRQPEGKVESQYLRRFAVFRKTVNLPPKRDAKAAWPVVPPCARATCVRLRSLSRLRSRTTMSRKRVTMMRQSIIMSPSTARFLATRLANSRTAHAEASRSVTKRGGRQLPPRFCSDVGVTGDFVGCALRGDGPIARRANVARIAPQCAGAEARPFWRPRFAALGELGIGEFDIHCALHGVED